MKKTTVILRDFTYRSTPQDDSEILICRDYRLLLRNPDNDNIFASDYLRKVYI
ncbi:MAG: hypothetical protein IKN67_04545 [Alphaproteobacteria bacterium]|nr:hypothetical protein [Alphaproteobacteria bacterium]